MIRADMIPDEVVTAAVKAFDESEEDAYVSHAHDIRVAIAAALSAWPGNYHYRGGWEPRVWVRSPSILLPLPQEASDD